LSYAKVIYIRLCSTLKPFVRSRQKRDQFLNRYNTSAVIKRALLPQIYTTSRARKSHFLEGRPGKGFSWRLVANRPFP